MALPAELHRFTVGEIARGFAAPLRSDRVGITFMTINGWPTWNMPMSAEEARRVAAALVQAADDAERMPAEKPVPVTEAA